MSAKKHTMKDDYLWDRSGPPDLEVAIRLADAHPHRDPAGADPSDPVRGSKRRHRCEAGEFDSCMFGTASQ